MTDYIRKLFGKYKSKGVIVDTNILLLLFVVACLGLKCG